MKLRVAVGWKMDGKGVGRDSFCLVQCCRAFFFSCIIILYVLWKRFGTRDSREARHSAIGEGKGTGKQKGKGKGKGEGEG